MFRTIVGQPGFRDHNWRDDFDACTRVTESELADLLAVLVPARDLDDPDLMRVIELTLAPESFESFLREHPGLPITLRDYQLSKLHQYLTLIFRFRFGESFSPTERDVWLTDLLWDFRKEELESLPQRFRPQLFLDFLNALPQGWESDWAVLPLPRITRGETVSRQPSPPELERQRVALVLEWRRATGKKVADFRRQSRVDKAEFYRWRRGEILNSSTTAQRIERDLRQQIQGSRSKQ